jgi:hypothetical protein
MRKFMAPLAGLILLYSAAQAENVGSSFGALMTAQSLAQGRTAFGGRLGVAEATSLVGTLGYGFSRNADGRVKLGIVGDDLSESELVLGADTKWQVWRAYAVDAKGQSARTTHPFDLALGPFVEWFKADYGTGLMTGSSTVTELGVQVVGSYPVVLKSGGSLSPYARLNAHNEWLSVEASDGLGGTVSASDSQIALGFNGGVSWRPRASAVALYGEVQIDGNNGVFFGLDYLLAR